VDYVVLRDAYIEKARKAEQAANRVANIWYDKAARELELRRGRAFTKLEASERHAQINDLARQWKAKDPIWKGHVADNQWYIQQAIMYGTAANGQLLTQLIEYTYRSS